MTFTVHGTASRFKVGTYAEQLRAIPPRSGLTILVPHHDRANMYNAARRENFVVRSWGEVVEGTPVVRVMRVR